MNLILDINSSFIFQGDSHTSVCLHNDCSKFISLDGNHKTNRLKCYYERTSFNVQEIGFSII